MASTVKRVTLLDLAHETGLSRTTVSYALNGHQGIPEATKEKVREAAQRMGYVPNAHARNLASGARSNTVELFVMGLDGGIITWRAMAIQVKLFDAGYRVPLHGFSYNMGRSIENAETSLVDITRDIRQRRPAAVVLHLTDFEWHKFVREGIRQELQRYIDEGGIVVTYGTEYELQCDQVILHSEYGTYLATEYLAGKGHRELALSCHGANRSDESRSLQFKRALQERGIPLRPEFLVHNSHWEDGGEYLANWFHGRKSKGLPCPTGINIINDMVASVFVNRLHRLGYRVPDDISVVGFDDLHVARHAMVPLTTVSSPVDELAEAIEQLVVSRLDGFEGAPRQIEVQGELVERESVRAL
jgi:LacI family transcriptional regulator